MAKLFPRSIRHLSLIATTIGAMAAFSSAHAAEAQLWKDIQKAGVLRCGAAVSAPYVVRDPATATYSGFFADLCRDFGERVLKVKVEFVDSTWDTQVAGLQSNKWDLAMALNQTPERAQAITFSVPANYFEITLLVNKDNPKLAGAGNNLGDYDKEGVTYAVMSGSAQDKAISAITKHAKILRLPGMDETRMAIMARRADVLVDGSDANHIFALVNPQWAKEISPQPALAKEGVAFGLRRDTSAADLQVLNIYLSQRRETGEIDALIDKATLQANAANKPAQ